MGIAVKVVPPKGTATSIRVFTGAGLGAVSSRIGQQMLRRLGDWTIPIFPSKYPMKMVDLQIAMIGC